LTHSWRNFLDIAGDEPRAALVGHVSPGPFENHDETISKANQEEDMNKQPS
jgi:hypothetical protein